MKVRERMRRGLPALLDDGERADVVVPALERDPVGLLRRILLFGIAGGIAGGASFAVWSLVADGEPPVWLGPAVVGVLIAVAGQRLSSGLLVVMTPRSVLVLSTDASTGAARSVLSRLPRDTPVRLGRRGLVFDNVGVGGHDLWVVRRFRRDLHALAAGTEPVRE